MAKFVVSDTLPRGNSNSGPQSMVNHNINQAYEKAGAETWYRLRMLLPSGTNASYPGKFNAVQTCCEGWNTFWSWHEYQVGGMSPAIGRSTWCGVPAGCLQVKWVGGRGTAYYVDDKDASGKGIPLKFDHWYTILVHVKWSHLASDGYAEVWIDGRQMFGPGIGGVPQRFATLWAHTDGRPAAVHMTVGHYRRGSSSYNGSTTGGHSNYGDDTTYVDDLLIGPTRTSVGG
jgi:Polysaccharide lyase